MAMLIITMAVVLIGCSPAIYDLSAHLKSPQQQANHRHQDDLMPNFSQGNLLKTKPAQ